MIYSKKRQTRKNPKVKIKKQKSLKKQCEEIWFELIKLRAGRKSEITGRNDGYITAHHIAGKSNYRLRFEPANGICLLNQSEHIFGVHSKDPGTARHYQDLIIAKIGQDTWEWLLSLKSCKDKQDLTLIKLHLQEQLKEFKDG